MKNLITSTLGVLLTASAYGSICSEWTSAKIGTLQSTVGEASGLIQSALKPTQLIWTNDSGNKAELYATGADGKVTRSVSLSGFSNTDFEALASGPCTLNKADSCIYVGDIGDGIGWRSSFKIGIFKESDFWSKTQIQPEKVIQYSYPSRAENAEALVVSHQGIIYVFSKDDGGVSQIYSINSLNSKISHHGGVNFNGMIGNYRGKGPRITDASLSNDNKRLLLLTYTDIVEVDFDLFISAAPSKQWRKGIDFNLIKGPALDQQETITYVDSERSFLVSTENPEGNPQSIMNYTCR